MLLADARAILFADTMMILALLSAQERRCEERWAMPLIYHYVMPYVVIMRERRYVADAARERRYVTRIVKRRSQRYGERYERYDVISASRRRDSERDVKSDV